MKRVDIGTATLYLGDCREILGGGMRASAIITDPPYSARTHAGHDAITREAVRDTSARANLGYAALSTDDVRAFAATFASICDAWIVWLTDHTLAPFVTEAMEDAGRYVFAPLPFYQPGRSVRITGDGPCSWTDWIVASRTKAQIKWGTLPGGYVAGPGWKDKARMGGKPTLLMESLVRDYSRPGDTVLDPFMGAGTTGVAAARTGRSFVGCEIDEDAFNVACTRIAQAQAQAPMFFEAPAPLLQAALL